MLDKTMPMQVTCYDQFLTLLLGTILLLSWNSLAFTNPCSDKPLLRQGSLPRTTLFGGWIDKGKPSYSNNFLLDFHNLAQSEYQGVTNKLRLWNEKLKEEQFSFVEWQDSFHRNGLSDFCPPMSSNLNCLIVGEGIEGQTANGPVPKLPWEEEAEADITSLKVNTDSMSTEPFALSLDKTDSCDDAEPAAPIIRVERVLSEDQSTNNNKDSGSSISSATTQAAVYDCIIDQGLMEAVLALDNEQAIQELSMEAATSIREHGIYVLITAQPLTEQQQGWLKASGIAAGLEWELELDGISDPKLQQIVSVARRFNTGAMPKVGKLSRYQV